MANPWFRMYAEFLHDPKVQMMSEVDQRRLVCLFCIRCSNGDETLHETFHDESVAFQLRISNDEWNKTKAVLVAKGIIDKDNNLLNWDKRQYVSDSSTARVAKHREKMKQQCNVSVTPPDTDTDTDTDTKKKSKKENALATRLPVDWTPSKDDSEFCLVNRPNLNLMETIARFKDYWIAQPGQKGRKLDWSATWRNWVRNERAPVAKTKAAEADEFFGQIFKNGKDKHHATIIDITPGDADEGNRAALPKTLPDVWEPVQVKVAGDDFV